MLIQVVNQYDSIGAFVTMLRDWFMKRSTIFSCTKITARECTYKLYKFGSSLQTELAI